VTGYPLLTQSGHWWVTNKLAVECNTFVDKHVCGGIIERWSGDKRGVLSKYSGCGLRLRGARGLLTAAFQTREGFREIN
jgi:hypothetical protein